ncbi:SPOR domain-containing protein [Sphingobacteriales bacterium UPWRP_1]|nr:hypothetical protein B6N25_13920 [Sphingobacteriales bacterium TSM_CSS]PSJ76711.1 SPOR domain-containing protein [Sphingobacteriales bacterium UPWRP_1]
MQQLFLTIGICFLLLGNLPAYAGSVGAEDNNATEEPAAAWTTPEKGAKLILIGIVVDRKAMQPMEGVRVELSEIKNSATAQTFLTKQDGNFYFKLESDKEYALTAFGKAGNKEDYKIISTVNKGNSDILRAILQVEPATAAPAPAIANFEVKEAPKTASANYSLSFKVQFGAFKQTAISSKSAFYTKAREMFTIETENTANGFVRYLAGNFADLSKAKEAEQQLKEKGYSRTFIVPYSKGQRLSNLSPEDAVKLYGNK